MKVTKWLKENITVYTTLKENPFKVDTNTGEILHPPTFQKQEDKNLCNPHYTVNTSPAFNNNTASTPVSGSISDSIFYNCTCNESLKALYKSRQYYPIKYSTHSFNTFYKGESTMYQTETLKICKHIECMNIAFIERNTLLDILQVNLKNINRKLSKMVERNFLKHYRYLGNDNTYAIVVNPCLFFKGDYNLKEALIRIHLKDTTQLVDYRILSLPVDNVNCKDNYSSSDEVKHLYKVWCEDKTQDNFNKYLSAIKEDSKRDCFKQSRKPYQQDYKPTTRDTNHDKDNPLSFINIDDLSFRLKFIV